MLTPSDSEASFILVHDPQNQPGIESDSDSSSNPSESDFPSQATRTQYPTSHLSLDLSYTIGSSPSFAHDWSHRATGGGLKIRGRHFVDAYGRVCSLRGVNLSGASKAPANHDHEIFPADHRSVTFVNRPFPLEEAPEHFARLRRWGLTFIRFLVTWEAIEHQGPGIYDDEYLTYIRSLLSLLPRYGLIAFVDLHQDVWSRYSGGSGAPAWTLEAVGFDLHKLQGAGAAWLLGMKGGGHTEEERGIWPCGYQKLSAATMATCFWAGDTFAPKLKVDTKNGQVSIQQFLQSTFLNAFEVLVRAVGDLEGVLGFEIMNEPHRGYVDLPSLYSFDYNTDLHLSHVPSAFQSFMLGAGHPTLVSHWTRSFPQPTRLTGQTMLNTDGQNAWRADGPTGGKCLWEMHGVWGWDLVKEEGIVLRENYFVKDPMSGRKIDWYTDFYYPFLRRWADRVRGVVPNTMLFVEPIPNEFCPTSWTPEWQIPNMIFTPHWYDLNALFAKAFGDFSVNVQGLSRGMFPLKAFYWGHRGARDNFSLQIRNIVQSGYKVLGEKPIVLGECGIPMDMNRKEAFSTDNFTWQTRMMDAMITALERSLVGFTLWNYNPDNNDELGDDWNGENFSWFSRRRAMPASLLYYEQTAPSLDNGGRILRSVVRPYPAKTAGIPLRFDYEMSSGTFVFGWREPDSVSAVISMGSNPKTSDHLHKLNARETEIFVPSFLTHGRKVIVNGLGEGDSHLYDETRQTLFILIGRDSQIRLGGEYRIEVSLDPPLDPLFEINGFWDDFGVRIGALLVVLVSIIAFWVWG